MFTKDERVAVDAALDGLFAKAIQPPLTNFDRGEFVGVALSAVERALDNGKPAMLSYIDESECYMVSLWPNGDVTVTTRNERGDVWSPPSHLVLAS